MPYTMLTTPQVMRVVSNTEQVISSHIWLLLRKRIFICSTLATYVLCDGRKIIHIFKHHASAMRVEEQHIELSN